MFRASKIAACQHNFVARGKIHHPFVKTTHPTLTHCLRKGKRYQAENGLGGHGRQIRKTSGESFVSDIASGMSIQREVLVLNDKISREHQIFVRFGSKHGTVVANAVYQAGPARGLLREASNHVNEIPFAHGFALLRRAC